MGNTLRIITSNLSSRFHITALITGAVIFSLQTCQQIVFLNLPPLQPVPQAAFHISRAVANLISLCTVLPKDLVPFSLKIENKIVQIILPYQLIQRFKDFRITDSTTVVSKAVSHAAEAIVGEQRHSHCMSGMVMSITYSFIIFPTVFPSMKLPYVLRSFTHSVILTFLFFLAKISNKTL